MMFHDEPKEKVMAKDAAADLKVEYERLAKRLAKEDQKAWDDFAGHAIEGVATLAQTPQQQSISAKNAASVADLLMAERAARIAKAST